MQKLALKKEKTQIFSFFKSELVEGVKIHKYYLLPYWDRNYPIIYFYFLTTIKNA
jgi:hypothetical protein